MFLVLFFVFFLLLGEECRVAEQVEEEEDFRVEEAEAAAGDFLVDRSSRGGLMVGGSVVVAAVCNVLP